MVKEYSGIERMKKNYEILRKKYNLPSFKELNEEFEIEKLQDKESETFSREIRRIIMEKNSAYLRFIEMMLNPTNAPLFFMSAIKNLSPSNKETLNELYAELGKFEIKSILTDIDYNEKEDAKFIKDFFSSWQNSKEKFKEIVLAVECALDKKADRCDKAYLG